MIAIVDYGMGNLRSVQKALEAVGHEATVTSDPDQVRRTDKAILPGVGAFADAPTNRLMTWTPRPVREVSTSSGIR